MHPAENALEKMLQLMEAALPALPEKAPAQKSYFVLYYSHLLRLLEGTVLLARNTTDAAAPRILLRSATECIVDLKNLAEQKHYYLVLQAMDLDERVCVFRYKSAPAYRALVDRIGQSRADETEKRLRAALKSKLKKATEHFPLLQNSAGKLTVLNRFRIADEEELYQTRYTALSMSTHNNASLLELDRSLDLELPMDALEDESVCAAAMRYAVDAIRYESLLFGVDEALVRGCIDALLPLKERSTAGSEHHSGKKG